ncbi:hypothetical protein [Desulfolutivibrio sulfoxidireducens]|uniref:hypothetical protein n=1 Tax=Desulfolutivibrio sulfoxidireducens TaxID=2773299 RepID=UPI00159E868E|nr:hypothetical protein [Desulfolutivibrio sulfoxidireducens]QLA16851.1 hypothetical protein GD605_12515 [Desulfolutivibrio sulfoxidireducens]
MKPSARVRSLGLSALVSALLLAAGLLAAPDTNALAMSKRPVKTPAMENAAQLMPEALDKDVDRLAAEYREIKGRLEEADNRVLDVERRIAAETTTAGKDALESLHTDLLAEQARLIGEAEDKKVELDYLREVLKAKLKEYRGK